MKGEMRMFCISPHSLAIPLEKKKDTSLDQNSYGVRIISAHIHQNHQDVNFSYVVLPVNLQGEKNLP